MLQSLVLLFKRKKVFPPIVNGNCGFTAAASVPVLRLEPNTENTGYSQPMIWSIKPVGALITADAVGCSAQQPDKLHDVELLPLPLIPLVTVHPFTCVEDVTV